MLAVLANVDLVKARSFKNSLVKVKPLGPYFIKETSFMPSESFKFCKKGYKWAEIVEYLTSKYTILISLTHFDTSCKYKLLS